MLPRHREAVQALWKKLFAAGDIYLGAYEGWYSIRDECFYTEDELIDDGRFVNVEPYRVFFQLNSTQRAPPGSQWACSIAYRADGLTREQLKTELQLKRKAAAGQLSARSAFSGW